jgi:nucleoside diphosphate kinase
MTDPTITVVRADLCLQTAMDHLAAGTIPHGQPNITFAMLKTDAATNNVSTKIMNVIRAAGFVPVLSQRNRTLTVAQISAFYREHCEKPYFSALEASIRYNLMPMILEHRTTTRSAVVMMRKLIGATDARYAEPGTIRHKFGAYNFDRHAPLAANTIHASHSLIAMLRDISIVFGPQVNKIQSVVYGDFYLDDLNPLLTYPE